jgi:hypothetical protein
MDYRGAHEVNSNELRYQLISTLLQADEPLTLREVVVQCGLTEQEILPVLRELVHMHRVVEGRLLPDKPVPQYCWGARWEREAQRYAASSRQKLQTIIRATRTMQEHRLDIDAEPVLAFYDYIIHEYSPPRDKRFLVFLQCSVRRPFSSSPSHASMRRAISTATGYDPNEGFERCPVHVVVLASKMGPVPYELEDIYPANIRGGGVKHFDRATYARLKPILAERMAGYIIAHRNNYERITTFTESRYGEVMEAARQIAGVDFPVLPLADGPRILRMGHSIPRKYWEKYWIQLYLEIVSWLEPVQQTQAEARLKGMEVKYRC